MKKSILRTSLALAVAGVLGTSVVAYAAEATQIQPVPVVKQETALSATAVKQEATAPVASVDTTVSADKVEAPKIDVSAAIKPVANENTKPAVTETVKTVASEATKPVAPEATKSVAPEATKSVVNEPAQPVVVPAAANPAAASMDADTTPVVAKDDKKDAKTTKVVKTEAKDHKTTKVVKSNKKVQPTQSVKTQKADKTDKAHK